MFATLEAKLIAGVATVLAALAFVLWYDHHERAIGASVYAAQVAKVTEDLEKRNAAELLKQHAADVAANKVIEDAYEASLQAANRNAADLSDSLRDYQARSRRAAVPGTPATPGGPDVTSGERSGAGEDEAGSSEAWLWDDINDVIKAGGQDAVKVIGLQQYIEKECH